MLDVIEAPLLYLNTSYSVTLVDNESNVTSNNSYYFPNSELRKKCKKV